MDYTKRTIETYDQIAIDYHVIATPEHRAWLEDSMREFYARLPGNAAAKEKLGGSHFYAFYARDELSESSDARRQAQGNKRPGMSKT